PTPGHHEFTDRLAHPGRQFSLLQLGRQGVRVSRITDGDGRKGLPPCRDSESLPRAVRIEAGHLVNREAASRGFHGQQGRCCSCVVLRVAVGGVILRESQLGHGNCKRGSTPGPTGIKLDRKSTRLNSSHVKISYAVFCLKKKKKNRTISK